MFQQTNKGICLTIKVIPKSSRTQIIGWENDHLKIQLAAIAEKGEANRELIRFLAQVLHVGKTKITIVSSETSRFKRICLADMSEEQVRQTIENYLTLKKK